LGGFVMHMHNCITKLLKSLIFNGLKCYARRYAGVMQVLCKR